MTSEETEKLANQYSWRELKDAYEMAACLLRISADDISILEARDCVRSHDEVGWPDDQDYERRLRSKAARRTSKEVMR